VSGSDPGFYPRLRLVAPDGALLADVAGNDSVELKARVSLSGNYTVLVANNCSNCQVGSGSYSLNVSGLTGSVSLPVINSFTANPSTIVAGQTSKLSWTTTNATTVSISGLTAAQPTNGSVSVSPTETTAYTLNATGSGGTATATTTITITLAAFTAPVLSGPAGAGVSLSPTFSWSGVIEANSYRLMVATTTGALPTDPASANCTNCAINTMPQPNYYTPSTSLNAATTYYWQVQGRSATKNGAWSTRSSFTTAQPPEQSPPDRGNISEDSGPWPTPASKAVVITHGWSDSANGWVKEMAAGVCGRLGAGLLVSSVRDGTLTKVCQVNNWDVWVLDWRSKADTGIINPMGAYVNAIDVGQTLASILKVKNYSHVHLVAHSAGANLIDFATIYLKLWMTKEKRPVLEVHDTFLDAYDPVSDASRYGKQADWTDNYVDTRSVADLFYGLDGTKLFLQNGYNIDVTPTSVIDNCTQFLPPDLWGCRHNRPYRFYGLSIDSSFVGDAPSAGIDRIPANGTGGMGYPLSLENGRALSTLNSVYPKGTRCVMDGAICYTGSAPGGVWSFLPGAVVGTVVGATTGAVSYVTGIGSTLFNSLKLGVISLLPTRGAAAPTGRSATTPTESPSWITVESTTTQPVNTMRFNWSFTASGEGFVRVFVDGMQVREIDQRHVSLASLTTEEIYIGGGVGTVAPGLHRIAFRLDGFGTGASGVELSGVELGLTSASESRRRSVRH
jgi:hypothetical protein